MKLVLVSGLSGSGKSVALKALEDVGYFVVDNLPATLIPALVESQLRQANPSHQPMVAISLDARTRDTLTALPHIIDALRRDETDCRLLFLEANDAAITRRFSETRRPHPLAEVVSGGIGTCIAEERRILSEIASLAHRIDTSEVSPNVLRGWIRDWLQIDRSRLTLAFQSFGFKHGAPNDADLVFDVRFLPNPYYDPKLRPLSGKDDAVKDFLAADLNVGHLIDDVASFLLRWLPAYVRDNRAALTVAIGCTGGQHRSVYIAEELAQRFGADQQVLVRHRDLVARAE